jgi:hypothetical protein
MGIEKLTTVIGPGARRRNDLSLNGSRTYSS